MCGGPLYWSPPHLKIRERSRCHGKRFFDGTNNDDHARRKRDVDLNAVETAAFAHGNSSEILLMAEILDHLGCMKPYK